MRCLLHKWSRWTPYTWEYTQYATSIFDRGANWGKAVNGNELRQRRTCERCGKMQDEKV